MSVSPAACFLSYLMMLKAIVRLVLDRNDQQASIFLQQKLKGIQNPAKRAELIYGILPFVYELCLNR